MNSALDGVELHTLAASPLHPPLFRMAVEVVWMLKRKGIKLQFLRGIAYSLVTLTDHFSAL